MVIAPCDHIFIPDSGLDQQHDISKRVLCNKYDISLSLQFGMSLMASAFCVLRISSWVLLVANGNLRKIPCVQYLLESLRKRNLIQTAVVVRHALQHLW